MSARVGTIDLVQFGKFQVKGTPSKFKQFIANKLGIKPKDVTPEKTTEAFSAFQLKDFKAVLSGQWKEATSKFGKFKQAIIASLTKADAKPADVKPADVKPADPASTLSGISVSTEHGTVVIHPDKFAALMIQRVGIEAGQMTKDKFQEQFEKLTLKDLKVFIDAPKKVWTEIAKDLDKSKKEFMEGFRKAANPDKADAKSAETPKPQISAHGAKDLVFKKDETQTIELPTGVLLDDSVTQGKVIGSYTVAKIHEGRSKFDLKVNGDAKAEAVKVATKKGVEVGEFVVNAKLPAPPANGDKKEESGGSWKNWGAALVAGISALAAIGTWVTGGTDERGGRILATIAGVVAGLALGAKWLGGFFGASTEKT